MNYREIIFFGILIANLIIVLLYLIWNIFRKEKYGRTFVARCIVMLICPLIGPFVFLLSKISYRIFLLKDVDLDDVIFSKEHVKTYLPADVNNEVNVAPMEEAINITEKNQLRTLLLNVVKEDVENSLSSIALALESDDTEVSHYAASVLQDSLNKLRSDVQKGKKYIEETDPNIEAEETVFYFNEVISDIDLLLDHNLLSDIEHDSMVNTLDEVCEMFYEKRPESIIVSQYKIVCMRLLESDNYDRCQMWCDRLMAHYPNSLASYSCQMKLSYSCQDKERFFETLNALRASEIEIDNETLEMIRVFM